MSKLGWLCAIVALVALASIVDADVYLHMPRGSNNRLDEANRDRNNGNRLFDSQNNNRGGANRGTFGREYFYEGSVMRIEWTNQHSCGNPNNNCDIILQYYCDANVTRDGLTTNRIPDVTTSLTQCYGGDCDADTTFGRHESFESYQSCKYRMRNKGLYTSTQDMSYRYGAIYTRQNNNGNRNGYECPEERDYYPYWHPTEWRDIAILTGDTSRCAAWQAESQNVKDRYYCAVSDAYMANKIGTDPTQMNRALGFIPITKTACELLSLNGVIGQGVWTKVSAFGIAAPQCEQTQWTRDNHLGNTFAGETPHWNWTIPATLLGDSCVFRLRYNISTRETRDGGDYLNSAAVTAGALNSSRNYIYIQPPSGISIDNNNDAVTTANPKFFKYADQLDVWTKYGLARSDIAASFDPNLIYGNANAKPTAIAAQATRGYVFRNDPLVDIFGSLLTNSFATNNQVFLRLALDTSQFGRTFQDRSHTFSIRERSSVLKSSPGTIYNLGVRGKRGNIVQVYPGVEYDFSPNELNLNQGDWIHFQWTGSNTNPGNNAGQGTAGTDRSNIVALGKYGRTYAAPWLPVPGLAGPFNGTNGVQHLTNWKLSYPARIDDPTIDFVGATTTDKRALALGGVYSPYFDYKPIQMTNTGVFNYICTRNNAFTNRGQKAQITVATDTTAVYTTGDTSRAQMVSASGASWIRFYPDPNGLTTNTQIQINELGNGNYLITPFLFDVIPGQKVMLDMTYTSQAMTDVLVYQSDYAGYRGNIIASNADSGVASVAITRGGYYHVEKQVAASAVAGIVVGIVAAIGLGAFGYWKLKQKFHVRDKKYIQTETTKA